MPKKYSEICECGGKATFKHKNKYGDAILKCRRCGDTFDAEPEAFEKYATHSGRLKKVS